MLFDDRDLKAFVNSDEKGAFKEVLQTYYSGNLRASIVSLYSLVMIDDSSAKRIGSRIQ